MGIGSDCIKSIDCFGQYGHFNNIDAPNLRAQDILCIYLYRLQLPSSIFYSFQSIGVLHPSLSLSLGILFSLMQF